MNRIIIARFPSLLEAESAVTCLQAADISAMVDNQIVGSMMPHASSALGGFIVSVDAEDEETAKALLQGNPEMPEPEESDHSNRLFQTAMRRGCYGAVIGWVFLPLVSNVFSIAQFMRAYRMNRELFWQQKALLFIGALFNIIGIATVLFFAKQFLTS